ncbi:hypothetical protein BN2537_6771 [Streptomyces venezuelae]|nr:hypothetical protein BN2537_6771 [Streptomyces venezuelae]
MWPAAARDAATGLGWGVLPLGSKGGERVERGQALGVRRGSRWHGGAGP